jgi:hypothetical protein
MKKIILSVAVLAMVLVGCKKEETKPSDSSSSSSTPKILKETMYSITNDTIISDSSITVYAYDSKGRLISRSGKFSKDTYEYNSANLITQTSTNTYSDPYNNVSQPYTFKYILDAKGLYTKGVYGKEFKDTMYVSYSADGFMKSYKIGEKTYESNVEIKDGNIIKQDNSTFEYYLDKTSTIRNVNRGINFYGKDSKNLVKSVKNTSIDPTLGSGISEYTYEFDSKNRVIKSTRTQVNSGNYEGSSKSITKYEYAN